MFLLYKSDIGSRRTEGNGRAVRGGCTATEKNYYVNLVLYIFYSSGAGWLGVSQAARKQYYKSIKKKDLKNNTQLK